MNPLKVYKPEEHQKWIRFQKNGPWHLYSHTFFYERYENHAHCHVARCQSSAFRYAPDFSGSDPSKGRRCKKCSKLLKG